MRNLNSLPIKANPDMGRFRTALFDLLKRWREEGTLYDRVLTYVDLMALAKAAGAELALEQIHGLIYRAEKRIAVNFVCQLSREEGSYVIRPSEDQFTRNSKKGGKKLINTLKRRRIREITGVDAANLSPGAKSLREARSLNLNNLIAIGQIDVSATKSFAKVKESEANKVQQNSLTKLIGSFKKKSS